MYLGNSFLNSLEERKIINLNPESLDEALFDAKEIRLFLWKLSVKDVNNYNIFDLSNSEMYNCFLEIENKTGEKKLYNIEKVVIAQGNRRQENNLLVKDVLYYQSIPFSIKFIHNKQQNIFKYLDRKIGSQYLVCYNQKFFPYEDGINYLFKLKQYEKATYNQFLIKNLFVIAVFYALTFCARIFIKTKILEIDTALYAVSLFSLLYLFMKKQQIILEKFPFLAMKNKLNFLLRYNFSIFLLSLLF